MQESVTQKLLTVCQECGHKHRENVYCHCFTEADDEDDPDDGNIGLINFDLLAYLCFLTNIRITIHVHREV